MTRQVKYIIIITLWTWAGIPLAQAQTGTNTRPVAVKVLTRACKDSIKLRWAPTNPLLWKQAQRYGYRVEKFLVYQSGKVLPQARKMPLPQSLFKVAALAKWNNYLEKDPQATIAYQAMFGKSMPISSTNRMLKVAQQAQQQELRFAFALMAADYSALTAKLSGLSFTDKAVKKGEKYLYRVSIAAPAGTTQAEVGSAYAGIDDFTPLPKPVELEGQFGDQSVLLIWNQLYYQQTYGAYYVERSEDGKNYQRTTRQPYAIIRRDTAGAMPTRYMTALDSLPQNNKTYYFRVRGVTPFAEIGPPSDTVVQGQGRGKRAWDVTLQKPKIDKNTINLNWKFDKNQQGNIKGFLVEKAPKAKGKYTALHRGILPANQRSMQDSAASGVSYYRVKALGKDGNEASSFPHLVQLPDSIPPDAPVQLEGKVDTNGVVTIHWKAPKAKDVKGYHLFRSEGANDEFSRVNVVLFRDTTYTDSISLRTLNPDIYYKVQAIDHYFNPSAHSEVLLLKRPDKTPPLPPAFVGAVSTDSSVNLRFQASASYDVAHHLLYRTEQGKDAWQLHARFSRLDTAVLTAVKDSLLYQTYYQFADRQLTNKQKYLYTLVAVDSAGLESPPSRPVSGHKINTGIYPAVKNIRVSKHKQWIELRWTYNHPQVKTFRIYRAQGDSPLQMYITHRLKTGGKATVFRDKEIKQERWYTYRIQAIAPDQSVSKFSKAIRIKY